MPTYDFTCSACGSTLTVHASIEQPTPADETCTCGNPMRRTYTAPAIAFKGQGWGGKP